jgi:DNA-binding MarR family transcriptional regulator
MNGMKPAGPSLLFEFFGASQRVKLLLADAMAESGLRPDEYAVYSTLVDGGSSSPTRMADAVGMPATTMSHYVRSMLERGHVRRETNPLDRRSAILALTPSGRAVHRRAARAFEAANRRFLSSLDIAEADARHALRSVRDAAEQAAETLSADTLSRAG